MRLKYYLRGAGVGIIVSTLILMIAFAFTKDNHGMSDNDVIKRATELGYVLPEEVEDSSDTDHEDISIDQGTEEEPIDNKEDNTQISEQPIFTEETAEEKTENKDTVVEYKAFTVSPGESSNAVAQHLYEAGLVDSAEEFNKYMNELGVDGLVQPGSFYLEVGSDYEDVVAILVTKQKDRDTTPPKGQ